MSQTVTIFGATGAQGAPVVQEALSRGMNVRAVARDKSKISDLHPDATAFTASLDNEDAIAAALDGAAAAFLHLPMPENPEDSEIWIKTFVSAAEKVSLPLLIYTTGSTTGTRYPSSVLIDAATARKDAILSSNIPAIVLQPTIYLENLLPELFTPKLKSEGILDYPPLSRETKITWTSHYDQARIAVAAMNKPELAGQSFEIGTPFALTGDQLATLLGNWVGKKVVFDPIPPAQFGDRIAETLGNPAIAFALNDLYSALANLKPDDMIIDLENIEKAFDVKLTSIEEHIRSWTR